MAAETPTNNFIAIPDLQSVNASIGEILSSPLSLFQSSCGASTSTVGQLQDKISSLDLSLTIPEHPELRALGYSIGTNSFSGKYNLVLPDLQAAAEMAVGGSISIAVGVLFAAMLYHFVLPSREESSTSPTKTRTLLIGSLICVISIMPYVLFDVVGIQNTAARFSVMAPFILYLFRTFEAAAGFVPRGADESFRRYCTYFATPAEVLFEQRVTRKEMIQSSMDVMKCAAIMSIVCTILSPSGYTPFGAISAGEFYEPVTVENYLNPRHLGNCFAIAFFFQSGLALGTAAIGNLVQILTGYKVLRAMKNPMLEATSPSDFWGKRWNLLVHVVLKRGVYKPVRRYASALIASLAVFVASGLFHEWVVHAVFLYNKQSEGVVLGSNTAFFVWNFVVIACERMLVATKGVQSLKKVLPRFMVTVMIIMSSLPAAHWFGGPYLNGNFFSDYETFVPMIRKM
mmetsp:Transcript_19134/g.29178  ORF Transcript_19134/g.29178 Transcript_19134/m.29178 type:complete len:457 (+) Transcript_19134:127-1497(+)